MLFGAAYYPEHRDPEKWDYDLDTMAEANVNCVRVGEFAWRCFEPEEGVYDFEWMDTFLGKAALRGIGVMMSPPLRTAPAWLVERDRSILIVDSNGIQSEFGGRYTFCINHPLFIEKGMALAGEMARRYGGNPAVHSWHLDNEYGDETDCHCPACKTKWQAWLAERYASPERLNQAWGTVFWGLQFDHFGQVPTPRLTHPILIPALWHSWRRFRSDCTVDVIGRHAQSIRPHIAGKPVTTNWQTLWNYNTDYFEASKHLDVAGVNYYPDFGEKCRDREFGLATLRACKEKNFWVLEARGGPIHIPGLPRNTPEPGELTRLCLHMIGAGVDGILFFRWRCAPFGSEQHVMSITGYDGRPRRGFGEFKAIGGQLKRLASAIEGTKVRSQVGVFYDFPARWYIERGRSHPTAPWALRGAPGIYLDRCQLLHRAFRDLNVNCDAVGHTGDFSKYRVLAVPMLPVIDDALAERFCGFVAEGGVLVWHPYSGLCGPDTCIYPRRIHPALEKLFGADIADFANGGPEEPQPFTYEGAVCSGTLFFDLAKLEGATVLAEYTDGQFSGYPAVFEKRTGQGRAIYVATFADAPFYKRLFARLLRDSGVDPVLSGDIPSAVEVAERSAPDGRRLIFLLNSSTEEQVVSIAQPLHDLWADKGVEGEVTLPPWGACMLEPVTSGAPL